MQIIRFYLFLYLHFKSSSRFQKVLLSNFHLANLIPALGPNMLTDQCLKLLKTLPPPPPPQINIKCLNVYIVPSCRLYSSSLVICLIITLPCCYLSECSYLCDLLYISSLCMVTKAVVANLKKKSFARIVRTFKPTQFSWD